jgi:hypothetical protein
MARCVILRHDLPDGTAHFDWLIEPDGTPPGGPDDRVLISFRVDGRPDDPLCIDLEAVRTPDHRRAYLTCEGEVSGGRGAVKRVAAFDCQLLTNRPDQVTVSLRVGRGSTLWIGRPVSGRTSADGRPVWSFEAIRG